jgi:exopolysaccharide biosynthesis polyprenyl glycosylphosphotransferase
MVRDSVRFIRHLLFVSEMVALSAAFFGVYYLSLHLHSFYTLDLLPAVQLVNEPWPVGTYVKAYWLTLAIWAVLLKVRDDYGQVRPNDYYRIFLAHFINGCLFFCFATSAAFIFKFDFLSRSFLVSYTLASIVFLALVRSGVLTATSYLRSHGNDFKNLLIVGTGKRARAFADFMAGHKEWGYRVTGFLDSSPQIVGKEVGGWPVIGTLGDLPRILKEKVIDQVVFVIPRKWLVDIEECVKHCEAVGVPATLSTDFFELQNASHVTEELDGFTYLTFETRVLKDEELVLKRVFDILVSATALLLTSPILIATALAIKFTSPGPIFFKQVRVGRNGRRFVLYKFRSMVIDAEAKLAELKKFNEMSGPVFKMTNDPRITPIGKFVRKTSLDEFPQFWNVLKGDMSIVGPRPPLPNEVAEYEPWHRRRLSMKPGITCFWQAMGRNTIGFEDWMKLDLQYIDRWSLWLDVKLLFMTAQAILTRRGAE